MGFSDAVRSVINQYVGFTGRAGRSEFWYWVLFTFVVGIVIQALSGMMPSLTYLGYLFSLATIVPNLSVGARRLHDIGKSGWLQLAWLIPILGWIYMIYLLIQPSQGPNAYGDAPASAPVAA